MTTGNRGCYLYEVKLEYSRLSFRLEGGDTAYKLYANCQHYAKSPFFLKFAPTAFKNPVKSVRLPGQKGLTSRQVDRISPYPSLKISSFSLRHQYQITCFTS
jgi:hypothetical protein